MGADAMNDMFLEAMKQDERKEKPSGGRSQTKKGKVVAINDVDVFLDMGSKAECVVPANEFKVRPAVGDIVDVVLKDMKDGVNIGSRLEAEKYLKMDEARAAFEKGLPVNGKIEELVLKDNVPKGYIVSLGYDIKGFLPLSHVDTRKDEDLKKLIGTSMEFAVIDYERNKITVSRREFLHKTIKKLYVVFFEKHKPGDILKGKVERVEEDFIVLSTEGIRAFMHVSDFSWKYLSDMRKVVNLGDEMEMTITRLDPAKNSVRVGRKQLTPDPWEKVSSNYNPGDVVKGKVVGFRREGAIIEVEDGVEAFLHVEEMSWTEKVRDPKKHLKPGDVVEVKIKNVEPERRRMDVSLRAIQENPWNNADNVYTYGKKVEGTITSIVDFGIFIRFEDGIEGLMRREDVDWMDSNVDLKTKFKKGDKVTVMVLELNKDREKLKLGYKQLSDNPVKSFSMNYPKGSLVTGVVKEVQENGAVIALENDLEGYIHISQISKEKIDKVGDALKVGDTVKAVTRVVDPSKNKIELSIKEYLLNEERIDSAKYMAAGHNSGMASIGSLLKEQLSNIQVEKKDEPKKSPASSASGAGSSAEEPDAE